MDKVSILLYKMILIVNESKSKKLHLEVRKAKITNGIYFKGSKY